MKKNLLQEDKDSTVKKGITVLNIRDARSKISRLVNEMENSESIFAIGRRKVLTTLLVPYDRYNPILSKNYKVRLAFTIVENLLGNAPPHIRNPQLEELYRLKKEDLLLLASIENLPLDDDKEKELRKSLCEPTALDRLIKRHHIAAAIASAQKEGLYESSEHMTNSIDLGANDEIEDDSKSDD